MNQQAEVEVTQKLLDFCQYAKWLFVELEALLRREVASTAGAKTIDFYEQVEQYGVKLIVWALKRTGGRQKKAAELLNMKETTLHTKIKRYKIDVPALAPFGVTGFR